MHILHENLRSDTHRTYMYGSVSVLAFRTNCTISEKVLCPCPELYTD